MPNKEPDLLSVLKRMHEKGYEFEELGGEEFNDILTKKELQAEWIKIDKGMFKLSNTDIFRILTVSQVKKEVLGLLPEGVKCEETISRMPADYLVYVEIYSFTPSKQFDIIEHVCRVESLDKLDDLLLKLYGLSWLKLMEEK